MISSQSLVSFSDSSRAAACSSAAPSFGSTSVCVYEVGADSITAGGTATVGMPGGSIGPQASTAVVGPDTSLHSATLQSATFDSFYQ